MRSAIVSAWGEGLAVGDELGDDAGVVCRLCGDGVAGQQHRHGFGLADGVDQSLGAAAAGDDAEFDLGYPEFRGRAGDDDVAGQRQFAAAAERDALHGGEDGLAVGAEVGPDVAARCGALTEQRLLTQRVEGGDVGAGAEHAVGAGEHHRPHGVVVLHVGEFGGQRGEQFGVEAVLCGGAVQGEDRHRTLPSGLQDCRGHRVSV